MTLFKDDTISMNTNSQCDEIIIIIIMKSYRKYIDVIVVIAVRLKVMLPYLMMMMKLS